MGVFKFRLANTVEVSEYSRIVEDTYLAYVPIRPALKAKLEGRSFEITRAHFTGTVWCWPSCYYAGLRPVEFQLHYYDKYGSDVTVIDRRIGETFERGEHVEKDVTDLFSGFGINPMYVKVVLHMPGQCPHARLKYDILFWVTWP